MRSIKMQHSYSRKTLLSTLRNPIVLATFALAVFGFVTLATAAQYPEKPVRIIVPFPAGSATDTVVRILGKPLTESLGQPVVVENKPGADGAIAATEVMHTAPDGYTLLLATNSPLAAVPTMRRTPPYDPIADFTPISYVGQYTYFIVINPKVPVKTLAEFFNYARANPGKLNYATGNTFGIISVAHLMKVAGINMMHVPYKGEPAAITDLIAGRVQFMFSTQTTSRQFVQEGRLRALANTNNKRSELLPDVPTLDEAGIRNFPILPWGALFGPAKMQPGVVERINRELNAALKRPEVREQLNRVAFEPSGSTPEELRTFLKGQIDVWRSTVRDLGLMID